MRQHRYPVGIRTADREGHVDGSYLSAKGDLFTSQTLRTRSKGSTVDTVSLRPHGLWRLPGYCGSGQTRPEVSAPWRAAWFLGASIGRLRP